MLNKFCECVKKQRSNCNQQQNQPIEWFIFLDNFVAFPFKSARAFPYQSLVDVKMVNVK